MIVSVYFVVVAFGIPARETVEYVSLDLNQAKTKLGEIALAYSMFLNDKNVYYNSINTGEKIIIFPAKDEHIYRFEGKIIKKEVKL